MAVPSLSIPTAARVEPAPASPGKQRRELYKNGSFRGTTEKPPARSMRDLMTADSDEERPASPRRAEFLANQRKQIVQHDDKRVEALVSKMKGTLIEQQLDAVLAFLNRKECLNTEGLHRISARQSDIDQAVQIFESGRLVVPNDAHVASALLKEMFKQTFNDEDTLIPRTLQLGLPMVRKQAIADRRDPVDAALAFFKQFMPDRNMKAYRRILAHLVLVAQHSEINKMGVDNLAKLFAVWFYEAAVEKNGPPGQKELLLQLEYSAFFAKVMTRLIEEEMPAEN